MRRRFLFPCAAMAAAMLWANVLLATTTGRPQQPGNPSPDSPVADAAGVPPSILVFSRAMGSAMAPPGAPRWSDRLLVTQSKQVFDYNIQLVSTSIDDDNGVSGRVVDRTFKYGSLPQTSVHLVLPYTSGPQGVSHLNDTAHWQGHLENITTYSLTGELLGTSNVATFKLDRLRTGNYFVYTGQIGVINEITFNTPENLDLSDDDARVKIAEWSDPHFNFNGNGNFNRVELLSAQEYKTSTETTTVPQTAREGAQAWNTQNNFQNNFDPFQDTEPAVAFLQSPATTSKALRKVQYKFKLTPTSPEVINWLEIFTPKDPPQPKSYVLQSWTPANGQTESPVYTIDPLAIDPADANAAQRKPTMDGTWTINLNVTSLAVDANRDGEIKLDASDATTTTNPYRFWPNDDIDWQHTVDGNDSEEDDLQTSPNGKVDWENNYIPSKRDLEDFARIQVSVAGLVDMLRPKPDGSADLYLGLKWVSTTGTPAIKLYRQVETDGGLKYLTDETTANQQINTAYCLADVRDTATQPQNATRVVIEGTDVFVLPTSLFSGLSEAQPKTYLLFEGCKIGKGQLKLVILKKDGTNYTEIGTGPGVWLDLKKIEDFYERWTAGDGNGGDPSGTATRRKFVSRSGNSVSYGTGFEYAADAPEENKYILYVHGWNMQPEEKNRFAETAFKRLYWQGYKGRFGVFCWPTTYNFGALVKDDSTVKTWLNSGYSASTDPTNYDRGEWTAWKSSFPLMQLLTSLRSSYPSLNVMAHSMGNIVAGEALRRLAHVGTTNVVDCYVASQAALPAHAYDGTVASDLLADVPLATLVIYADGGHPETPNIYPNWLAENSGAAGRRVNFYNVNDYALWRDKWEVNQFLKPDASDASDGQPWTYKYLGEVNVVQDLFIRRTPVWSEDLHLGNATIPQNRWEIMAFAAEARSRAVGAKDDRLGMTRALDLTTIWPDDTGQRGSDGQKWGAHKWHSAQFRSTNMRQKGYWEALLDERGFNLRTTP